jgi:hypothetical protein
MPFLLGVVVLLLLLWLGHSFTKADPKQVAKLIRWMGGGGALIFAAFLLLRGEIAVAVPLGLFGFGLLGWAPGWPATFGARTHKSAGQASQIRTAFLEMQLDHDSGAMHGRVLSGRYEGVALDALDVATLMGLLGEIDSDSRDLLTAYLDRREPGWRERAQGDASPGRSEASRDGKMTEQEAYLILGVEPGANAKDISRAHRALMKKLHPDQGGTTYLAARINEAKDILLRRRR